MDKINKLARRYNILDYNINPDTDLVDIYGDLYINYRKNLKEIPLKFGEAYMDFDISFNNLYSLKNSPSIVYGSFRCSCNQLTNLEGAPNEVGGRFTCVNNKLISLNGVSKKIDGDFDCSSNYLKNLDGLQHSKIDGDLNFRINSIRDIYHLPKANKEIELILNPVHILIKEFIYRSDKWDWIHFFNDCDIIRDDHIIWDRLVFFYDYLDEIIDKKWKNDIKEHYNIVE
jgi:hypothetical protein